MRIPANEDAQFVVEKLAEGLVVSEVEAEANALGYCIDIPQIVRIKREFGSTIAELVYAKTQELLKKVPRANKFLRVQELDSLGEKLEEIIHDNLAAQNLSTPIIKSLDILLKIYRQIAEETNDLEPMVKQQNTYIAIIQNMSPEQRTKFLKQAEELKQLTAGADEAIDVEFTPD